MTMGRPSYHTVGTGVRHLVINVIGRLDLDTLKTFEEVRLEAQALRDQTHVHRKFVAVETPWQLAGQPLLMMPYGKGHGQWKWLMQCPAARIDAGIGTFNDMALRLTLNAAFLADYGYQQAWQEIYRLVLPWLQPDAYFQISAIGLFADVAGRSVDTLKDAHFVTRSKFVQDAGMQEEPSNEEEDTPYFLHTMTRNRAAVRQLTFSQQGIHTVMMYDKEIEGSDADLAKSWQQRGWNGQSPVMRIEAWYERDSLHELGCEAIENALHRLDALWRYTTLKWIRHTNKLGTDGKKSRWPVSAWWKVVQQAQFEQADALPAQRQRTFVLDKAKVMPQVLGYIEQWAACDASDEGVPDAYDIQSAITKLAQEAIQYYHQRGTDFGEQVMMRRRRVGYSK